VHARLQGVAKAFGPTPAHRRELRSLPPELAPLAEGLYHVRPLLSPPRVSRFDCERKRV